MEAAGYCLDRYSAHQLIAAMASTGHHTKIMGVHLELLERGKEVCAMRTGSRSRKWGLLFQEYIQSHIVRQQSATFK